MGEKYWTALPGTSYLCPFEIEGHNLKRLLCAFVASLIGISEALAVDGTGKPLKVGRWYTALPYDACVTKKLALMVNALRWVNITEMDPDIFAVSNRIAKRECFMLKRDQRYQVEQIDDKAFPFPLACVRTGEKVNGHPLPCGWTPQIKLSPGSDRDGVPPISHAP
jgi:hypothetical protein